MPSIHSILSVSLLLYLSSLYRPLASLPVEDLLLAGRATFLVFSFVIATITFTRWRRAAERDTAHTSQQMAAVLERLDRLEAIGARSEPRLAALGEQIEMRLTAPAGSAQSYPIAIRLARAGAEPEELISSCGLTRREAELVARLHGRASEGRRPDRPASHSHPAAA